MNNTLVKLKQLDVSISLYPAEQGGRKRPISSGYRPRLFFAFSKPITALSFSSDCILKIQNQEEEAAPGSIFFARVGILADGILDDEILSKGNIFEIREGSKVVGEGKIIANLGKREWA